jgi:hypothetical protein
VVCFWFFFIVSFYFFLCGCGRLNVVHYTVGFGFGCFLCLGCFSVVVLVWEECLCHTGYVDCMYCSVGVCVDGC